MHNLLPCWTNVGFTGHRKLEHPQLVADSLRTVLGQLQESHGPLSATLSAAIGADTLFLEEVSRRGLPYFLVFPFRRERFRQDFSAADWERVTPYFDAALTIDEVDDESTKESYMECGVRTVDRADVVVAVWDGEPASGLGGTGDVVEYARSLGKPLVWIHPSTGEVRRERFEAAESCHGAAKAVDGAIPPRELVEKQFQAFNAEAKRHGPAAQQLTLTIIRLHLAATALAVAALVLAFHGTWDHVVSVIKLAALSTCLVLAWMHRRCHHEWIHSRTCAEICRSYLAIWPMRRRGASFPALGADQSSALVRSLQMLWRLDKSAERPFNEARQQYASARVRHQIDYFDRKYRADGRRAARLQTIATLATIAALVFVALALAISLKNDKSAAYKPVKLLAVILPLIPPAALSVVVASDLARRAARHSDVTARLHRAEHRLSLCRTWPSLWREVVETEDLLMREVAEWHAMARYAGESH